MRTIFSETSLAPGVKSSTSDSWGITTYNQYYSQLKAPYRYYGATIIPGLVPRLSRLYAQHSTNSSAAGQKATKRSMASLFDALKIVIYLHAGHRRF